MAERAVLEMTGKTMQVTHLAVDFLFWQQDGSLELSPKFQRRPIWKDAAKAYFIDTLLRGFPVPAVHIRRTRVGGRPMREVIDGQQRLRALLEFFEGQLKLTKSQDAPWADKALQQLSPDELQRLQQFQFPVVEYEDVSDATVLEVFSRINTYSVGLNAQELRNGRWFGAFKTAVYELAFEYLDFWRSFGIFTEAAIARMNEAQLISELLVMQMDGIQDKKASLNSFYEHLDSGWGKSARNWRFRGRELPKEWLSERVASDRLRKVLEEVRSGTGPILRKTKFRRASLFYSLFGAIYHRYYGLPGLSIPTPRRPLTNDGWDRVCAALFELSEMLSSRTAIDDLSGWRREFVEASARQTDNIGPRVKRLEALWSLAALGE